MINNNKYVLSYYQPLKQQKKMDNFAEMTTQIYELSTENATTQLYELSTENAEQIAESAQTVSFYQ
jgi:hypothetical protein